MSESSRIEGEFHYAELAERNSRFERFDVFNIYRNDGVSVDNTSRQTVEGVMRVRDDHARHFIEAGKQAARQEDWRPIESAPQDGTRIIAWFDPAERMQVARWVVEGSLNGWTTDSNTPFAYPPILWQPLPATPVTREGAE